tara:strand:+ start:291 stop:920 length:630 start_codon:yes stop_codon:yes gene_type:complete
MSPLKKTTIKIAMLFGLLFAQANVQLHYDIERQFPTSTIEMFKLDDLGSTFFFVDFDYDDGSAPTMSYWEISRTINIKKNIGLGMQYNGGLDTFGSFEPAYLIGVEHSTEIKGTNLSSSVWGRYTGEYYGWQFTGVWFTPISKKISFTGFFDLWNNPNSNQLIWMTEPQLWYSFGNLSIGGEIEISKNFVWGAGEDIQVMPTLGVKWEF